MHATCHAHKTHNYAWLHRTKTRAPGHFNSPYRLRSPLEQENCHPRSAEPYFYNWVSMYCSRHSLHVYSVGVTWTLCHLVSVSGQPRSGRLPDFLSSTVRTPVDCWLCFRVVRQTQTQVSEWTWSCLTVLPSKSLYTKRLRLLSYAWFSCYRKVLRQSCFWRKYITFEHHNV